MWHVHTDAFDNFIDLFIPLITLSPQTVLLETRSSVETVVRDHMAIRTSLEADCEVCTGIADDV